MSASACVRPAAGHRHRDPPRAARLVGRGDLDRDLEGLLARPGRDHLCRTGRVHAPLAPARRSWRTPCRLPGSVVDQRDPDDLQRALRGPGEKIGRLHAGDPHLPMLTRPAWPVIPGARVDPARRRANARAAAADRPASVMARTTTTRVAPAASTSSSRSRLMPPIANQGRRRAPLPGDVVRAGPGRSPGGPAWSASSTAARRRSSPLRARRPPRRPEPGCGCCGRSAGPGRRMRRATGTGRSSWPRWSTSAPAARATSARSFTASSRPCRRQASANTSSSASSSRASRPFSRSCTMSTPAPSTASRNCSRSPGSRRASVHR